MLPFGPNQCCWSTVQCLDWSTRFSSHQISLLPPVLSLVRVSVFVDSRVHSCHIAHPTTRRRSMRMRITTQTSKAQVLDSVEQAASGSPDAQSRRGPWSLIPLDQEPDTVSTVCPPRYLVAQSRDILYPRLDIYSLATVVPDSATAVL